MGAVRFVFAVHNHQPVGNFDYVIEAAYEQAYRPFLAVMDRHPTVRFGLHQPGILWEWIRSHHPEYIESVQRMVERGQLELLSGGYYEPILPVIPEADRQGQIAKLNDYLAHEFGVTPRGGWLAERVWEPHLAEPLARAGLEYSVVDDSHFKSAGHSEDELRGYFMTEENGFLLRLFPISQKLRYTLPFAPPEDTIEYLRAFADADEEVLLVHADDGEKFGTWPGTHELCFEQKWLERFLVLLEQNADWLLTTTFSECLDHVEPRGRTYLPTASYAEMTEWALPPEAQRKLHRAIERVTAGDDADDLKIFVRGGFWRNFLARYPEANWMHKRMLYTSRKRRAAEASGELSPLGREKAADALWAAQCNCAYWHGLFGGLYLPHLRSAIYSKLIEAENELEKSQGLFQAHEQFDFDADGQTEVLLRSSELVAIVKPHEGGAVFELDVKRKNFNVLDLMTRREEAYHDKLRALAHAGSVAADGPETVSIHDMVATKEEGLEDALHYDRYRRGCFIEHLLKPQTTFDDFDTARLQEIAAFAGRPYAWRMEGETLVLEHSAPLVGIGSGTQLYVEKKMSLNENRLLVDYMLQLDGGSPLETRFAVELAANFLAGQADDRYYEVDGVALAEPHLGSRGSLPGVRGIDLVDEWLGLRVKMSADAEADIWRAPLETVSNSESGFERIYQGSSVLFVFPVHLHPGAAWRRKFEFRVQDA